MRTGRIVSILFCLSLLTAAQDSPITLQAGTVLDGKGKILRNVRITIHGGEIVSVDQHNAATATYDLRGLTVLPGWIDVHDHITWHFGANGRAITNPEATQMLYSMYPSPVKRWINARGGLTPHMIFLRGKELQALYKPCYLDAQASATRTPTSH